MLYIIQSVIMKALWDPEAGRLLSLPCRSSIHKKVERERERWEDKGKLRGGKKKAVVTEHKNKSAKWS